MIWMFFVKKQKHIRITSLPKIYSKGLISLGERVRLWDNVKLKVGKNGRLLIKDGVSMGSNISITVPDNEFVVIGCQSRINDDVKIIDRVTIGENVVLANGVQLISFSHQLLNSNMTVDEADKEFGIIKNELIIEDGVFLGAQALLFGACIIGSYSTVGAGVVLSNKTFPSNYIIYSPNNFRKKKQRNED